MDLAFCTEKGAAQANEDACLAMPELGLFMVCDGLGQNAGGGVASQLALSTFAGHLRSQGFNSQQNLSKEQRKIILENILDKGIQDSSKEIFIAASKDSKLHRMCTTVDILLFSGNYALIAHVGSGRIYLFRNNELHQLTEDHTQLAHLRRSGKLEGTTEAEQAVMAKRLTRAVGFQEQVKVDFLEIEMQVGDKFFLFTDGVWMLLDENILSKAALGSKKCQDLLHSIKEKVEEAGAKDNFSIVAVEAPIVAIENIAAGAEQKIKMLGTVPAFAYLSYQDLIKVISVGDLLKMDANKVICKEGDAGGEMMLILSGAVEIRKNDQKINSLKRGDVFGELSMIDEAPRSATVIAQSPTNLLAFPRESLFKLFREHPDLTVKFLWGVTMETNKRLRSATNKLVGKSGEDIQPVKTSNILPFTRSF